MSSARTTPDALADLTWLASAKNEVLPVDLQHPVWVRSAVIHAGPSMPGPASHPSCELNLTVQGKGRVLLGGDGCPSQAGDMMLYPPGTPHWFDIVEHPYQYVAIHFHPSLLFETTPTKEGVRLLSRFTLPQGVQDRVVRPSAGQRPYFEQRFEEARAEFEQRRFGWELKLRGTLLGMVVELLRLEQSTKGAPTEPSTPVEWQPLLAALRHLHEHHSEPVYACDLARAIGVSETRLKAIFQQGLGMSWTRYLCDYRLRVATSLLSLPKSRIMEVALGVGFETLSHFNAAFRSRLGLTPREFLRALRQQSSLAGPGTSCAAPGRRPGATKELRDQRATDAGCRRRISERPSSPAS